MVEFSGVMLFASHDHQVMQTVANRVIELLPGALIDRRESYDEYIVNPEVLRQREAAIRSTPTSRWIAPMPGAR
jgi:ATPase subunit of ABC transporter with duplicated ATPase domains